MQDMPPVVLEWVMAAAAVWNTLFVHPVMKESKIVCFPSTDRPTDRWPVGHSLFEPNLG